MESYLMETSMLDFSAPAIENLIERRVPKATLIKLSVVVLSWKGKCGFSSCPRTGFSHQRYRRR